MTAALRRKTPFEYAGIDLRAEARRYCRKLGIELPNIRVRHSGQLGCSGCAWSYYWRSSTGELIAGRRGSGRVVLTIGEGATVARVLEVLLHELVHVALPGEHHNERFCALVVKTARELWGVKLEGWTNIAAGDRSKRAYVIGDVLTLELQALLENRAVIPTAANRTAPVEPLSLEERRLELTSKREEHARNMLEKNKRKLRSTQKLVQKWRVKVKYYEKKAAAKKGET